MLLTSTLAWLALGVTTPPMDSTPSARALARVLDAVWEHALRTQVAARRELGLPVERLPSVSRSAVVRDSAFAARQLRALRAVRGEALDQEGRVSLAMLRWELGFALEAPRHHWLSFESVTPYSTPMREVVQGFASLRLSSAADVARYRRLLGQVAPLVDSIRAGLEARARRGLRLPRPEIPLVVAVFRSYRQPADSSPFAANTMPAGALPDADRRALRDEVAAAIGDQVNPAIDRLVAYLTGAYASAAPTTVGLGQYPGGRDYYRFLVRRHTTLDISPADVHATGLREVERIERDMLAIREELGFTGSAMEFHERLRGDRRFYAAYPEEVGQRLMEYDRRIAPEVSRAFRRVPRALGDVRRLDPRLEGAMTFGYYAPGDASDPMGHYYYNGSKLDERSLIGAGALTYHELVPGHHYQVSLQLENTALPPLRRRAAFGAFTEGWGDYASALAGELGMYRDPWERYGRALMEVFLACRLVVDTGMNELGWPRERALEYMRERVIESPTQLATEMLRYSVDLPGQALSYKMGAIELARLRDTSRLALGDRFDLRDFHAVVLEGGSLPLAVLASKVREWLGQGGGAAR